MMLISFIKIIFALLGATLGSQLDKVYKLTIPGPPIIAIIIKIIIGAGIGYLIGGLVGRRVAEGLIWMEGAIQKIPLLDILLGVVGLILGLIVATLISLPLWRVSFYGQYLAILVFIIMGYLGIWLATRKSVDIGLLFRSVVPSRAKEQPASMKGKILDTSVVIDGRIVDVCATGFISGELIVPTFVLRELQMIADSEDQLRRNRGRRGLDVLAELRKEPSVKINVLDKDYPKSSDVDMKLVMLAKEKDLPILTGDYNLNKVAALQDVTVLNLNDLANALKPAVLPGENMRIHVLKVGKEQDQGVGYLEDGTMVVVEKGSRLVGHDAQVIVTSVLQTSAGRMIFTRLQDEEGQIKSS
ncbi:MAG: TRAM domain-containing protein [Actinomycetota bacterium]|nr:TRAM domain-containing protein [Actinomycetota bacterium]